MFLTKGELYRKGFKSFGDNVLVSRLASFYGTSEISLGDNVRIDDFCILSGNITIGSNIHIGAYSALYGKYGIVMEDYTGLSPRCTIFSATDDFGGNYLISPMNPPEKCNVTGGVVRLERFVQLGSGTVVMPNLTLKEGVAIGAMSFVRFSILNWEIWAGNPIRFIGYRGKGMIDKIAV